MRDSELFAFAGSFTFVSAPSFADSAYWQADYLVHVRIVVRQRRLDTGFRCGFRRRRCRARRDDRAQERFPLRLTRLERGHVERALRASSGESLHPVCVFDSSMSAQ